MWWLTTNPLFKGCKRYWSQNKLIVPSFSFSLLKKYYVFFLLLKKLVHGQVLLCFFFAQNTSTWSSFVVLFSLAKFIYAWILVCNQICYKLLLHMNYDVCRLLAFLFNFAIVFCFLSNQSSSKNSCMVKFSCVIFICKALLCLNLCLQPSLLQTGYIRMLMNCMCIFKVMIGSFKFSLNIGYTFEGSLICECPWPLLHVPYVDYLWSCLIL
jgi:hypothetical protein